MPETMDRIRIGTRGSKLALKQAALVQEAFAQACGGIVTELVIVRTRGDRIQDRPLSELGDKGVFASELEQALLAGQIDLAVHSAKDLPVKLAEGLTIAAVLPRADVRDVLVVPRGGRTPVERQEPALSEEAAARKPEVRQDGGRRFRIGTGSRRRQLFAGQLWEDVVCENIRGNVDTRLRKLRGGSAGETEETVYDGIILAKAGLDRLEIMSRYGDAYDFYPLSPEAFLPAACQGIIAVEAVRDSDAATLCGGIADAETALCYLVEREAAAELSADCSEAAAAWCRITAEERGRETVPAADADSPGTAPAADRLLLDVMYAGRRAKVTSAVNIEEGKYLARCAALEVKGEEK